MNNSVGKISFVFGLILGASTLTAAQQPPTQTPVVQSDPVVRTEADENFELNIGERRITERDFAASTSVGIETPNREQLRLQVGVGLRAQSIDVLLRNVRGTVRFRGSIQRILDVVNSRSKIAPEQ